MRDESKWSELVPASLDQLRQDVGEQVLRVCHFAIMLGEFVIVNALLTN